MADLASIERLRWALVDGDTAFDQQGRAAALLAPATALGLGSGEIASPGAVVGAFQLGVDEAVDGLAADDGSARFELEPANHLVWRPALGQEPEHAQAQGWIAIQPCA
jgi:hypothetical protein